MKQVSKKRVPAVAGAICIAGAALGVQAAGSAIQGPSSSAAPYVLPVAAGVKTVSILSVGDAVNNKPDGTPYRFVGIPDGLGAYPNGEGTFELVVNHELGSTVGIPRAHGEKGAFVSHWKIHSRTLRAIKGEDQILDVVADGSKAFSRFCSGDLAAPTAFYDRRTRLGSKNRIYLNGEETGNEGRAFAHVLTGSEAGRSYELPYLGKTSYENSSACPLPQAKTIVISQDDSTPGQVYVYVGQKQRFGNEIEKAGLTGGALFGVKVNAANADEDRATGFGGATTFSLASLGSVAAKTGAQLQADSEAAGVTEFLRPEDGAWDPKNPSDYYFVTTDRFSTTTNPGRSRLWRLRFADLSQPELGGRIDMLLDGTEGQQMFDNLCVDGCGHVMLQEDPGNQAYLAKVWQYTVSTDSLKLIAQFDPAQFTPSLAGFITQDEESSGIIDANAILGPGWFLMVAQVHKANPDAELAEYGQLLALYNPESANCRDCRGDRDEDDDDHDEDDRGPR